MAILDYRRTDLRNHTWLNPYWITSALVDCDAAEDLEAVLFSFPTAGKIYYIEQVIVRVSTGITAASTVDIGSGTIATDAVTTGGAISVVDADEYVKQGDIAVTAGTYGPTTANTSDWLSAKILGSYVAPYIIIGAAATVPVVYATIANPGVAGTIVAGKLRVHMLITEMPTN